MSLEMGERDDNVGVGDGAADLCLFDILAALHRNQGFVGPFEAVGDYHLTAGAEGVIAVLVGGVEVFKRVLAAADIERVAVCEEGFSAKFLNDVRHNL